MKAIVFHSEQLNGRWKRASIQIEERAKPVPSVGEALLQVVYCGICGSDFSMAASTEEGGMQYPGLARFPLIPGHEFSAKIAYFGPGIHGEWKLGDPVIVEETSGCGICTSCKSELSRYCENIRKIGFTHDGAFASFLVVPLACAALLDSLLGVFWWVH